jgi:hypothetical protein
MVRMILSPIALSGFLLVSSLAAAEDCKANQNSLAMLVCMDQQAAARAKENRNLEKVPRSTIVDPVDQLKAENDKVGARLKGICRGC